MKKLTLFTILMLSGCASMDEYDRAWYVMHAVDVAQTYQISRSNCHVEIGDAAIVMGENPESKDVIAWGIGTAVLYDSISDKLPKWAKHVSVGYKGFTVSSNERHGIGISNTHCDAFDGQYDKYWM